ARERRADRAPGAVRAGRARGGDRGGDRPPRAARGRGGGARRRRRIRGAERRDGARPSAQRRAVDAGEGVRHLLPGRGRRQRGRGADMVFGVPALIAYISAIMTLEPGDLIATGTPEGVGPLRPGDVVDVEVAGVSATSNPVVGPEGAGR